MAITDHDLLRPAEVAERLGVSRSWLYAAAKEGRIPCVRLGGEDGPLRFLDHELDHWLEGGRRWQGAAHAEQAPAQPRPEG